jgi:hypothetical protein
MMKKIEKKGKGKEGNNRRDKEESLDGMRRKKVL